MKKILLILMMIPALVFGAVDPTIYNDFNTFAEATFSAEADSLYYVYAGGDDTMALALTAETGDEWQYISENSATVAFSANLPCDSTIHYGLTTATSDGTVGHGDRRTFNHVKSLTGLSAGTVYYYKIALIDERGFTHESTVRNFTTRAHDTGNYTYLGSGITTPYVLQSNTSYVLTGDITADTRAFTIGGANVLLDLNGYTVSYDNGATNLGSPYTSNTTFGIVGLESASNATIINGVIEQGVTGSASDGASNGHISPIHLVPNPGSPGEVAGVEVRYHGVQVEGIKATNGDIEIHHNIFKDMGSGIINRSSLMAAIKAGADQATGDIHHNLIARSRGVGIDASMGAVTGNEVYVDSYCTNNFLIRPRPGNVSQGNKLFGTGYHAVGYGFPIDVAIPSLTFHDNLIHLHGITPNERWVEYGTICSMNGIRMTQYQGNGPAATDGVNSFSITNCSYTDNVIIVKSSGSNTADPRDRNTRGMEIYSDPYISGYTVTGNIIKAQTEVAGLTGVTACVSAHGDTRRAGLEVPVIYRGNTFISNNSIVNLGDIYAQGGNHKFVENTFIKEGNRPAFNTIHAGFDLGNSVGNAFVGNTLVGGASLSDVEYAGTVGGTVNALGYTAGELIHVRLTSDGTTPIASSAVEVTVDDLPLMQADIATGYAYSTRDVNIDEFFTGATDASGDVAIWAATYSNNKTRPSTAFVSDTHTAADNVLTAGGYTLPLTDAIMNATTSEGSPLVINMSDGSTTEPATLSINSATRTATDITVAWTGDGSALYHLIAVISGVSSYSQATTGTTLSYPVAAGAVAVTVKGDTSSDTTAIPE